MVNIDFICRFVVHTAFCGSLSTVLIYHIRNYQIPIINFESMRHLSPIKCIVAVVVIAYFWGSISCKAADTSSDTAASEQDIRRYIEIVTDNDITGIYLLTNDVEITFKHDTLCLKSGADTDIIPMSGIRHYRFKSAMSGLDTNAVDGDQDKIAVDGDELLFYAAGADSHLIIYDMRGNVIARIQATANRINRFSLNGFGPGVYVVNLNKKNLKIVL